jgi:hypothetical protein
MRRLKYLLLLLPLFYFATGFYFHQVNGLYSVRGADPEYIYFINGLSVANGKMKVGNIDHPGVPFDYIMAASLRITHFFRTASAPFNHDVLANPDMYLRVANLMIILLVAGVILWAGFFILNTTKNLWFALIVQFSPFATDIIYGNIGRLPTENLIPVPVILLTVLIVKILEKDEGPDTRETIWLALVSMLALSLKLTLAPLLLIPFFLIRPIRNKVLYVLVVIGSFLIFAWPVTLQLDYFYGWIKSLILYSGQYGQGEKNVLIVDEFWPNIVSLYRANRLFFIYSLVAFVLFITSFLAPRKLKAKRNPRQLAITTFIVLLVMVFALGKQYKTAYFIPALMLLPLLIVLTVRFAGYWLSPLKRRLFIPAYVLLVMGTIFYTHIPVMQSLSVHFGQQNQQRMQAFYFMQMVEKDAIKIVVPGFYGSPVPEFALMTSYQWAGKYKQFYAPVFADLYPNSYIFYPWDRTLNYWGNPPLIDRSGQVYVYFDKQHQKEEFADSFAEFIPGYMVWEQVFFHPETEEIIYKLSASEEDDSNG